MITQNINYEINTPISAFQFIDLLKKCSLGERRPLDNVHVIKGMLDNADLTITAWIDKPSDNADDETNQNLDSVNDANSGKQLVGIARCVTDFSYCCYLSDIAVDEAYQHQGIGKQMIEKIEQQLPPTCKIILLSAPQASDYYPKIGFTKHDNAWVKVQS